MELQALSDNVVSRNHYDVETGVGLDAVENSEERHGRSTNTRMDFASAGLQAHT
jgi:hypothetical protein